MLTWNRFWIFLGAIFAAAVVTALIFPDSGENRTPTGDEVMKVVFNKMTSKGRQITLKNESGDRVVIVTGSVADAILAAKAMDGEENPKHEVYVKHHLKWVFPPAVARATIEDQFDSWREAQQSEMW